MKRPVLVVSPIPSHPRNQGNSERIYRLCRMFQLNGYPVHFVYYGLEGLSCRQADMHRTCWDRFYFVHPGGSVSGPSLKEFYHVDDWFDDRVSRLVVDLCRRWDYCACIANYVWCSKHLEEVPDTAVKIIDTHDVFGDRHLVARAAGMEPVWFYTSVELESMALNRADVIIAIQDQEADYFRKICSKPVVTVGHAIPYTVLPKRRSVSGERLRVGYLGSGNPFNMNSILAFQNAILQRREVLEVCEFHLAGSICRSIEEAGNAVFRLWGVVNDVADFYREMDVMVNPMVGGTGLKIKSVEVLAHGKPLIATMDAMVGVAPHDEVRSPEDVVSILLKGEIPESDGCYEEYGCSVINGFMSIVECIEKKTACVP